MLYRVWGGGFFGMVSCAARKLLLLIKRYSTCTRTRDLAVVQRIAPLYNFYVCIYPSPRNQAFTINTGYWYCSSTTQEDIIPGYPAKVLLGWAYLIKKVRSPCKSLSIYRRYRKPLSATLIQVVKWAPRGILYMFL
jgi:hypothetical protein